MSAPPFPVAFRLTRHNRNSVAAVLAVLETELEAGSWTPALLESADDFTGDGLLAYSFTTLGREAAEREVRGVRERCGPSLLTIAGGPHPSAAPESTLALGFRWAAVGEAGPAFAGLVRSLARGEMPEPGVLREGPGAPLDTYPSWPRTGQLFAHIEITRGCPMSCGFCQTPRILGRRPRHRSLPALERIFTHAVETGHRYTRFVAPNAFGYGSPDGIRPNPEAVEALLALATRCGMRRIYFGTFPSEVRPESVTDEMLALVRTRCHNDAIAVGLQSGSDRVLREIRRGHTVAQAIDAIARIARAGFTPKVDFIFGLPGETNEDRAATVEVIRRIVEEHGASVHAHQFEALPGTPLGDAPPAPIDARTQEFLASLTGRGLVTGIEGSRVDAGAVRRR